MTHDSPSTVTVSRAFSAAPERLFDAWLDPAQARRWLFATPHGEMVRAEIAPHVGGEFCFVDRRDGVDVAHVGTYEAIERPHRLVFTFGVPAYSPEMTRVSLDFAANEAGCTLTLTHEGVLPEYQAQTATGWSNILDGLATSLG